jgi:hypothetical protein
MKSMPTNSRPRPELQRTMEGHPCQAKSILPSSGEMPRPQLLRPIQVFIPPHLSRPLSPATDPLLVEQIRSGSGSCRIGRWPVRVFRTAMPLEKPRPDHQLLHSSIRLLLSISSGQTCEASLWSLRTIFQYCDSTD